jgi:hypothetical protein
MPMSLLLTLASLLYLRVLLVTLGIRGPCIAVAATPGLFAQRFQHAAGYQELPTRSPSP